MANHPRIFLPILFFLVGTVTYAVRAYIHFPLVCGSSVSICQIFDPIRVFMVEGKMNDRFDYKGKRKHWRDCQAFGLNVCRVPSL